MAPLMFLTFAAVFLGRPIVLKSNVTLNERLSIFMVHLDPCRSGVLTALTCCDTAGATWNCCHISPHSQCISYSHASVCDTLFVLQVCDLNFITILWQSRNCSVFITILWLEWDSCWWCCVCCIVLLTLCVFFCLVFYEPAMTTTNLPLVGWLKFFELNWIWIWIKFTLLFEARGGERGWWVGWWGVGGGGLKVDEVWKHPI